MLKRLLGRTETLRTAEALYDSAVGQARRSKFYADMGVPDTVDGRFDMIVVHVFLILRRLKGDDSESNAIAQALFDAMFGDMDRGLRELGAGDLGVGRRVKTMAKAFFGRVAAYEKGLSSDDGSLDEAILRNIFRGDTDQGEAARRIAGYMRIQVETLDAQPIGAILSGQVTFNETMDGDREVTPV